MAATPDMSTLVISLLLFLFMTLGAFPMGLMLFGLTASFLVFGMSPISGGPPAISLAPHSQVAIHKDKRGYGMNTPLTETEIQNALSQFPGWTYTDNAFAKRVQFQNFREAISFIVRLSFEAEALNHHPELKNVYHTVEMRLTTHDAGNRVTGKDLALIQSIESFNWVQ